MKTVLLTYFFLLIGTYVIAQDDTTIIKPRKEVPLQANAFIESYSQLYKGYEYTITIVASSDHDIRINVKNASIELYDRGDKSTGGLKYKMTPLDTGECRISIGLIIDTNRQVSLLSRSFYVKEYTTPPIFVDKYISGSMISTFRKDSVKLTCRYPSESGVFDTFKVSTWKAKFNDHEFHGTGEYLTGEIIELIRGSGEESVLQINADLIENFTGHNHSKGVYIVEIDQ